MLKVENIQKVEYELLLHECSKMLEEFRVLIQNGERAKAVELQDEMREVNDRMVFLEPILRSNGWPL